jgi:hypothetical protein
MAYNKREFIQEATIQIGAALVKVFDEGATGIIGNGDAAVDLAEEATNLACELAETLENSYRQTYGRECFR